MLKLEIWLKRWKLKMLAEKCSYTVFSNKKLTDIKLFCKSITLDEAPKFLGTYFDKRMTFSRQIAEIKNNCMQRLNIIKIISHRSWKLNEKALIDTYSCLVRSIVGYSFIFSKVMSPSHLQKLQRVQNRAVKYIFKPWLGTNLIELATEKNILKIESRLENLFPTFVMKGLIHSNPLLGLLIDEYKRSYEARECNSKTCLYAIRGILF
jgi:hypothetical protein